MAASLSFGPFELLPERRQLLVRGEPVRLGSRALELLIALTERAGELMSRSELESRLWPSTVVEETSLRVHVSALRKALGDGADGVRYIANVPGRGYSFVAPVERAAGGASETSADGVHTEAPLAPGAPASPAAHVAHKLPGRIARVIGREVISEALAFELRAWRMVSLVGAGGMGKTTLALLVAQSSLTDYPDGVRFVDFSPLQAGSDVLATLADALDLDSSGSNQWDSVQTYLRDRHMLLVLDNCEHVVQSAAELVEVLLQVAPELRILATSREALEVQGERVHRLEGLLTALDPQALSVEQGRALPAVQLFIERASAAAGDFELRPDNLKTVCEICERLDGMPLAIELAAARIDALGIKGLAARLEQMFEVLTRGRRTAFPRHRTLLALLDWSHALLGDLEQSVLRRLSMFRSSFTLELAAELCRDGALNRTAVIDAVLSLVAKSLVAVDRHGDGLEYRLLYTTRSYAEEKLAESGERPAWRRRHAEVICDLLEAAHVGGTSPWRAEVVRMIEDLHLALEWSQEPDADWEVGQRVVLDGFTFLQRGGSVRHLREPIEILLEKLQALPPEQSQPQLELRLRTALYFIEPTPTSRYRPERVTARALELVAEVGDTGNRIELHYGLYVDAIRRADHAAMLVHGNAICELTTGDYAHLSVILADRLMVLARHYTGDHAQAWTLSQRVLAYQVIEPIETRFGTAIPFAISMGGIQARIRWLQGHSEEAQRISDAVLPLVSGAAPVAACQFIGLTALPLAVWRGDLAAARRHYQAVLMPTARSANLYWISWERMLGRVLRAKMSGGPVEEPIDPDEVGGDPEHDVLPTLVSEWVTPRALARAEAGAAGWSAPEVMRAEAEKRMAEGRPEDLLAAQRLLERARDLAVSQGALAWTLRIASSAARLALIRESAPGTERRAAHQALAGVLLQFTEGLQDADPREARRLLDLLLS